MKRISLAEVEFSDYYCNQDHDIIGGSDYNIATFVYGNEPGSSAAFAARALGSAEAILDWCKAHIDKTISARPAETQRIIAYRFGELLTVVSAMRASWTAINASQQPYSAHEAKIFCSTMLQQALQIASQLVGGSAFVGNDQTLGHHYRDALALTLIDTPNDILLTRIGSTALNLPFLR